jgi:hypothetical protein
MSGVDALVDLDIRTDEQAPTRIARVRPEALIDIVRATVSVGGAIWIRVTGKSMNPIIRHGDRVLITALRGAPRRGTVVLLDGGGVPILHRVVRHRHGWVITKGDSRRINDAPHPTTAMLGRAVVVRRGRATVCLAPTIAFGVAPLLRGIAWRLRTRVPNAWILRVSGRRAHAG